ncbi:MAG TPA: GTPase [Candidatus Bathyarchaeia archaeon]|nr:GTPase [Candidatus Bathyarchaeia archaeon]
MSTLDETTRERLVGLRAELNDDVALVRDLRAVFRRKDAFDSLLADLDRQLERVGSAAVVTLVGATGAGKSTLLNALAGRAIAVEGVDRPTTREPVIYAPVAADLSELLAGLRSPGSDGGAPPARVVRYPADASGTLAAQILVDAPDLNSVAAEHRATLAALAERSDVLLVVLHRQSIVEQRSVSFVDDFVLTRRLVLVLNRADELTSEAREELLAQARRLAAERWRAPEAPVLATSARAAQRDPQTQGWQALRATLDELARAGAIGSVRCLNVLGTVARIAGLAGTIQAEVRADLHALPEETASGLEALASRIAAETATRLALRRPDLDALIWSEAGRRWNGPGGLALRTGRLGSLGVGASALLARRNPLLAAGAAVGSLAADQLERLSREQRLAAAGEIMPEAGEFASWYADALAPARARVARLTEDGATLAPPPADELRVEVATAVEQAWATLVGRDLPLAAERSALRFFRVVLDLPLYALGVWVIYLVGRGFFSGDYVGVDFLLNAALLAAAYLFVVRQVVRRTLALVPRRLLRGAIASSRIAIETSAQRAVERVRDASASRASALLRLAGLEGRWRAELTSDPPP